MTAATERIAKKAAAAQRAVNGITEVNSEVDLLRKQIKDIDATIKYLVEEYGSEWCSEGRHDVNTRLMRVGLSPICTQYAYLAVQIGSDINYSTFRANNDPDWVAARAALAKVGITPVTGAFNGDTIHYCDSDGDY
jgi:hypothetical protein